MTMSQTRLSWLTIPGSVNSSIISLIVISVEPFESLSDTKNKKTLFGNTVDYALTIALIVEYISRFLLQTISYLLLTNMWWLIWAIVCVLPLVLFATHFKLGKKNRKVCKPFSLPVDRMFR